LPDTEKAFQAPVLSRFGGVIGCAGVEGDELVEAASVQGQVLHLLLID
jgi:hypothetical protein